MKNSNLLIAVSLLLLTGLSACEDFIEADLSKKSLTVIAPADNSVASVYSQTFWWEELKGATKYQIQIVKPSFDAMQLFITDTSVAGPRFTFALEPGTYQWRIRAINSTSVTEYVTRTLVIDSTLDLAGQPMYLFSPADNYYSNRLTNTFAWQTMPTADSYVMQILISGGLYNTQTYAASPGSYTFPAEGIYQWRVFAQNSTSNSSSATRTITIDTTRPPVPAPLFPVTDTSSAEPIVLGWTDSESNISFHLMYSTDSTFSTFRDTVTAATTFDLYGTSSGVYTYWKVSAVDKATNESAYITRRRIKKN